MMYRRFGKTELPLSVITLGGMRYPHGWDDPRDELPADTIACAVDCTRRALECGINHIETAHGYGKSEHIYGKVLNEELSVPRDSYYFMTKGWTSEVGEMRGLVEKQLAATQLDFFDSYAIHGINNQEKFAHATCPGGPAEELLKLKEEGLVGAAGFSTHGPLDVTVNAIETGLFDFVNLHYYYFLQRHAVAVHAARQRDMGVFIISPNDKGGQLFHASDRLRELTAPLTPIQWNARFCLRTPGVHTLSFGMTAPSHFEEMAPIAAEGRLWGERETAILHRLDAERAKDPHAWYDGCEIPENDSGLNVPEILRFRTMWKCYDMETWCAYRYNMFQDKGDWFPGTYATPENVAKLPDAYIPESVPLKEILTEFHDRFYKPREPKG
jgi:predicted aldo/keto reductase-like oxidoreductase